MIKVAGEIPCDNLIVVIKAKIPNGRLEIHLRNQKVDRMMSFHVHRGTQSQPIEPNFKPCRILDENGNPPEVGH